MQSIKEYATIKNDIKVQDIANKSMNYSRLCILSLSLMSGFGLPWNFDKGTISKWLKPIDNLGIKYTIPDNITLIRAIYKKSEPRYLNAYNGNQKDFHNFLWDDSNFEKTITPHSQAFLIMNEIMLAKYLYNNLDNIDSQNNSSKVINNIIDNKVAAIFLANSAIIQGEFLSNYLRNSDGLFIVKNDLTENPYGEPYLQDGDTPPIVSDQAFVLKAFCYISQAIDNKSFPIHKGDEISSKFKRYSKQIYEMFLNSKDEILNCKTRDLTNVLSACIQFYLTEKANREYVLEFITILALELESRVDMSGNVARFSDQPHLTSSSSCFNSIKALIEAYNTTGIYKFLDCAGIIYKRLDLLWNPSCSLYSLDNDEKYEYTCRDIGSVLAGLNYVRLFGSDDLKNDSERKMISFFKSAIESSEIIPINMDKFVSNSCEKDKMPNIILYKDVTNPADEEHLSPLPKPPVFFKKFTYKPKKSKYSINGKSFYSDYGLFTSYELINVITPDHYKPFL